LISHWHQNGIDRTRIDGGGTNTASAASVSAKDVHVNDGGRAVIGNVKKQDAQD